MVQGVNDFDFKNNIMVITYLTQILTQESNNKYIFLKLGTNSDVLFQDNYFL